MKAVYQFLKGIGCRELSVCAIFSMLNGLILNSKTGLADFPFL